MNLAHISTYWTSTNPILELGSYGLEVDTNQYKLGDGLTNWNDLTYYKSPFEWIVANGTDTYTSDYGKSWYELSEFIGYYEGLTINVIFANANTGTCSLNLSGYGAKTIKKNVTTNLSAGDIIAGGTYQLTYDSTNWQIQGFGGGGSVYTVNNGLTEDVANHFQLGGQLVKITSIGTIGDPSYYLEILGDATNYSPTGILWVHGAQYAIYGEGSSVGIAGESTSIPIWSINKSTGRNNIVDGFVMNRSVPLALTGMGVQTHINLSDSAGTTKSTALIITKWTTATAGSETAQQELWLRNAGATEWQVHTVKGTGQLQLNKYGVNTFAGTPAYAIGVDASGNVVEYAVSSGGLPIETAAGTVDIITATYSPALVLADKLMCAFVATGANTSTTPTFNANGTGAKTIVKQGGQALVAGDIPNALTVCILEYNLANTRWELLNPSYQTQLALKAPLASPVFTGNPTAPTPSAADNDTSIATTAFVQTEIANLKKGSFGATWNGQGGVVANSNTAIVEVTIPYAGTITDWNVESYYTVAGVPTALAGTIVFDIYRSGASIIGAGNKPTLTAASSASAAVSGWTSTAVTAGDKLYIYIVGTPVTSLVVSVTIKTTKS